MRGRLFLKIYLTFLGVLVALAVGMGIAVTLSGSAEDQDWRERRIAFVADFISETDDPGMMQARLNQVGPAIAADITVLGLDGKVVAAFGPAITQDHADDWRHAFAPLPGGKVVLMRVRPPFDGARGNPLILLAFVTGVTALVAWPVVRHLTRRLERLRRGVEAWGEGDLALRVEVEGRDEIAAVATSFNRAAAHVEALVDSHRTLLANASHELRSPLARLRMVIDLYEGDRTTAHRDEILRNLAELDDLVGEVLLASRLNHTSRPADLGQKVDILALAAEEAARAGIGVTGDSGEVTGDARLLSRMVRNLIQNAQRHGEPPIEVTVGVSAAAVELRVRDYGQGVSEDEGDRVFEPFYRPQGHGESPGGWGLGLSLVRQIASHHGGTVRYEAPQGGGACFVVLLPVDRKQNKGS
jgi:signal transduction histidine kinase